MRPKHALWLAAALICSAWYTFDPQARFSSAARTTNQDPGKTALSPAPPTSSGDPRIAMDHRL
jgi:hypothetical protein